MDIECSETTRSEYILHNHEKKHLIKLCDDLSKCKCCKRHSDYNGINKKNYLPKDYLCACSCRHYARYFRKICNN